MNLDQLKDLHNEARNLHKTLKNDLKNGKLTRQQCLDLCKGFFDSIKEFNKNVCLQYPMELYEDLFSDDGEFQGEKVLQLIEERCNQIFVFEILSHFNFLKQHIEKMIDEFPTKDPESGN